MNCSQCNHYNENADFCTNCGLNFKTTKPLDQGVNSPQVNQNPPQYQNQPMNSGTPPTITKPLKETGIAYYGTFKFPGFAFFYVDKIGMGILFLLLPFILFVTAFISIILAIASNSVVPIYLIFVFIILFIAMQLYVILKIPDLVQEWNDKNSQHYQLVTMPKSEGISTMFTILNPGFVYYYKNEALKGFVIDLIVGFLYSVLGIGFLIHLYLLITANSEIKKYNFQYGLAVTPNY